MQRVVPAIIPTSWSHLESVTASLSAIPELQLDLVADPFVTEPSWPYNTDTDRSTEVARAHTLCQNHRVEVDLMVADPLAAAQQWLSCGAKKLVVHIETMTHFDEFLALKQTFDYQLGLSLNNDTALSELLPHLAAVDYVQCMGIAEIGAQGQPFDERVLDRVRAITAEYPELLISVDGSVNQDTIPRLHAAGVGRFVVGSAIVLQNDPAAAHAELTALVDSLG